MKKPMGRRHIGKTERESHGSSGVCFWCRRPFGSVLIYENTVVALQQEIDHIIPYAESKDDSWSNLCACCQLCNAWKSDRPFVSVENTREFLVQLWNKEIEQGKIEEHPEILIQLKKRMVALKSGYEQLLRKTRLVWCYKRPE